jgi:hypothetical protein
MMWFSDFRPGPGPQMRMAAWSRGPAVGPGPGRPGGGWGRYFAGGPGPQWGGPPQRHPGWGPPMGRGPMAGRQGPPGARGMGYAAQRPAGPGAVSPRPFAAQLADGILPRLKALFDRLDRNHDGKLEFREFAAVARIFGQGGPGGPRPALQGPSPKGPPGRPPVPAAARKPDLMRPMIAKSQVLVARLKAAGNDRNVAVAQAEIKKAIQVLQAALKEHAPKKPGKEAPRAHDEKKHSDREKGKEKKKVEKEDD